MFRVHGWPLSPVAVIAVVGVLHRTALLWIYSSDLKRIAFQNRDWLTWQYFPREMLTHHLAAALVYLQETPPLPQIVVAAAMKLFEWPLGVARGLITLQGGSRSWRPSSCSCFSNVWSREQSRSCSPWRSCSRRTF